MVHEPVVTNSFHDIDHLPTRDAYDRWAAIYDGEGNPLVAIEEPHVDRLLGEITPGMKIADIGCGTGRHAIRLAVRGAEVTALDFSEEMLNKAREKAASLPPLIPEVGEGPGVRAWRAEHAQIGIEYPPRDLPSPQPSPRGRGSERTLGVRFIRHDLAHRLPLEDQSFDRVLCSLVLDHIPSLTEVFAEMKRICRPTSRGGSIVVSSMHPAMMLRGVQARFTDPVTGRETRPQSCPHQISDYIMAAINAGLTIDHLSEHCVDEDLAHRCPRAEKYLGWPLLLMMRLRV